MKAQYFVIQNNQDEDGNGDYLSQYSADTYEEAKRLLEKDMQCDHIDYWTGSDYLCEVDGPVPDPNKKPSWKLDRDEYGNWIIESSEFEFKTESRTGALWLLALLNHPNT